MCFLRTRPPRVHFSALQPQRKDLLIRFGQRLQEPFRVDLRGDLILKLRMLVGTELSGLRAVYDLVDAQHLRVIASPLRSLRADVSEEDAAYIQSILPKGMLLSEAIEVVAFYKINKLEGTDWALYPSIHFEAYFGNTNFTHKYQAAFFKKCGHKTKEHCGMARYSIYDNIADRVNVTEITG